MGSRKLEELYREFDAYEDDDLLRLWKKPINSAAKKAKRKAMDGGMGFRTMMTMIMMNFVVIGHVEVVTVMERDAV